MNIIITESQYRVLLNESSNKKKDKSLKINNEYVVGELKQIRPQIFAISIKDNYQRTMLFCRYIEFFDSPYKEIKNKFFTWEKFMAVYKDKFNKDSFTYPKDWEGFSISSKMIKKAISVFGKDKGPYDEIMGEIYSYCSKNSNKSEWYLIGVDNFTSDTIDHEIAHALYEIDSEYKKKCDKLISLIDKDDYQTLKKKIVDMGYMSDKHTINNEIQAFMSTKLSNGLDTKRLKEYQSKFINNFKDF